MGKEHLGKVIKRIRQQKGLSQLSLADGICAVSTISQIENMKFTPKASLLAAICNKLGVRVSEISPLDTESTDHLFELVAVYVAKTDYMIALDLISECESRDDLIVEKKRKLILYKAECLINTSELKKAIDLLQSLLSEIVIEVEQNTEILAECYNKIGNAYYLLPDMVKAYSAYTKAFELTKNLPSEYLVAVIRYNFARCSSAMGYSEDALSLLELALMDFSRFSNVKEMAHATFAAGIEYKNRNNLKKASEYLERAAVLYSSIQMMDMVVRVKSLHATKVLSQMDIDRAEQELIEAAYGFRHLNDIVREVFTYARLVEVLIDKSESERSQVYYEKLCSIALEDLDPKIAYILRVKAKYNLVQSELELAMNYAQNSATMFTKMGHKKEAALSYRVCVDIYFAMGDFRSAAELSNSILDYVVNQDRKVVTL